MADAEDPSVGASAAGSVKFTATHWSVVPAAGERDCPHAAAALEQLCRTCWYPLCAYVRRRGYSTENAQDLTREFFARLLEKRSFSLADPARGRFRTFLLHALDHFLANEWISLGLGALRVCSVATQEPCLRWTGRV
jgi:RNA polymerase sigma-70 factor (ECF subfamily)